MPPPPAPAPAYDPVETGFLEARGRLMDVAAFLDRVERRHRADDYRVRALRSALGKLARPDAPAQRAASVLRALSDRTSAPVPRAGPPAAGAPFAASVSRYPKVGKTKHQNPKH